MTPGQRTNGSGAGTYSGDTPDGPSRRPIGPAERAAESVRTNLPSVAVQGPVPFNEVRARERERASRPHPTRPRSTKLCCNAWLGGASAEHLRPISIEARRVLRVE